MTEAAGDRVDSMHDDRGALVYAPSADRLAPLTEAHARRLVPEPSAAR
ncbi:MAG TPA: hypothetical protein VFA56_05665 [Gaiellaceae bacterium]|nr:hypothetical protein [Gaiellaceae bacterium]